MKHARYTFSQDPGGFRRMSRCLLAAVLCGALVGCAADESGGGTKAGTASAATPTAAPVTAGTPAAGAATTGDPALIPDDPALEAYYIIPPSAARVLAYRIHWQAATLTQRGSSVKLATMHDDSIFLLDGENFLTRMRREDGDRVWRLAVAEPVDAIQDVIYLPETGRVFVMVGGEMLVLDAATGAPMTKQRLDQSAATGPVVYGPMMIYASRTGRLVWHAYDVGQPWRAYQVSSSLRAKPLLYDGAVVAAGEDGRVTALDAGSVSMMWEARLLAGITAPPVAGNDAVYIAGLDQHVWAFDANDGWRLWRYLSESALTEPPTLIGERLYQQIPTEGLVCLDAVVKNTPGGKVIWRAPGVTGNVLADHKGLLWVWDRAQQRLTLVSAGKGNVVGRVNLPRVRHIWASALTSGELYACSNDGLVIRLDPRK